MKRKTTMAICLIMALWSPGGCGWTGKGLDSGGEISQTKQPAEDIPEKTGITGTEADNLESEPDVTVENLEGKVSETETEQDILHFVDVFGKEYETVIRGNIAKHPYDLNCFIWNNKELSYQGDSDYGYRLGVDVSHHQGAIHWQTVKSQGYEFAFLRIGYRGYGTEGPVCLDETFFQNIEQAHKAGMDVGVYFFSQAVNEEEALEEAEFVLENLSGYELELPVVYDPENILDAEARTDHVSGEQFTKNAKVFCEKIREEGFEPMIYSNMLWEAFQWDLEELTEYPVWYADYEPKPQTPYDFSFWQYTNEGVVEGISGNVDLNIQMTEK